MKLFAPLLAAGLAGYAVWKILSWIVLPIVGLAVGLVSLVIKVGLAVLVGWFVLRLIRPSGAAAI